MPQYTIQLNLGGDLVNKLSQAEKSLDRINSKADRMNGSHGGSSRGGGGNYQFIPRAARGRVDGMWNLSRRLGSDSSKDSFYASYNNTFKQFSRFQNEFVRNSFTISGWRRNLGNFMGSLESFAGAVSKTAPLFDIAARGLVGYGLAAAASAAPGGIIYGMGSKILNSAGMTEAISNRMQLNMAEMGLGPDYKRMYDQATEMSAQYGFSRSGIMSTANVLTGLGTGSRTIDADMAMNLARIIGKVSMISGRPYESVSTNMQQILGVSNPNMRDIRELIHQAPILAKYATQEMRNMGASGQDPREWLKTQENLIKVLNRLDASLKAPRSAEIRGQMKLNRENLWLQAEEQLTPFWEDVGYAQEQLYKMFSEHLSSFSSNYNSAEIKTMFDSFVNVAEIAVNALENVVGIVGKLGSMLNGNEWAAAAAFAGYKVGNLVKKGAGLPVAAIITAIGMQFDHTQRMKELSEQEDVSRYNDFSSTLIRDTYLKYIQEHPGFKLDDKQWNSLFERSGLNETLVSEHVPKLHYFRTHQDWNDWGGDTYKRQWERDWRSNSARMTYTHPLNAIGWDENGRPKYGDLRNNDELRALVKIIYEAFDSIRTGGKSTKGGGVASGDTTEIEDLTKGSKSLIINFNAPLVDMPTTINGATNAESIVSRIQRDMEAMVSRAMHIAINNATDTL